ncbi:hypothetical protein VTN77DRAFT_793 [Rasamsonia byssochlamydoides]|uniref:uncharacterized protein n=1 Tax=Rasamsonia byssochlamydoides TaxID=89139 RepID=UPI003743189F
MDSGSGSSGGASADHGAVTGDGPAPVPAETHSHDQHHGQPTIQQHKKEQVSPYQKSLSPAISLSELAAAQRSALSHHNMHMIHHHPSDLEHYFVGPRDLDRHSKWPTFMRMHGSVLPRLILPLLFMAAWSTVITCVSVLVHPLEVSNILLTVLGFVVGLALSFRSSTAYERYADGRKSWALLIQTSRNMARTIWVSIKEREGEEGKEDLLGKVSAINLLLAFAVALKHCLRFEPDIAYKDLVGLVRHLDTFAKEAHDPAVVEPRRKTLWKATGEYLGVSFAESNPRKLIKRAKKPLGHLPLEILIHLSAYIDHCVANGTLSSSIHQSQLISSVSTLNEVLTGAERVRDTPMPEAYNIAISQIAWIYILVLPFQLIPSLKWLTIPGSVVAAYIILSLVAIGRDLENPFGDDVNDLPLDTYCRQLASELDIITATPAPKMDSFLNSSENLVLYPLSLKGYDSWKQRSVDEIRAALRTKVIAQPPSTSEEMTDEESVPTKTA